jgi:predicted acylesterase/phospholipase RssA
MARSRTSQPKQDRPVIGLALAGGGPQGAIYEIGALRALEEALIGPKLHELDVYVGVSAGAFVGSCLINGITTEELCRATMRHGTSDHFFSPSTFVTPAFKEWVRSSGRAPRLLWRALQDLVRDPEDATTMGSLSRLAESLPIGVFDNAPIRDFLHRVFTTEGRTDDFRELERKLVVVAADLDSGEPVRFGEPGMDHVPISQAVQASSALPGLYPPVDIDGRHYVDGVLLKTLHGSVALDHGVGLLFAVNPIVPIDTAAAVAKGVMKRGKLLDRGLPGILSQTFRTLVHSRMRTGFEKYGAAYSDQHIVLIEPRRDDYRMFFTNIFSFKTRKSVCEYAYQATRRDLLSNWDKVMLRLEPHGLGLRRDVLEDPDRDLWTSMSTRRKERGNTQPVTQKLGALLDRVESMVDDDAA